MQRNVLKGLLFSPLILIDTDLTIKTAVLVHWGGGGGVNTGFVSKSPESAVADIIISDQLWLLCEA